MPFISRINIQSFFIINKLYSHRNVLHNWIWGSFYLLVWIAPMWILSWWITCWWIFSRGSIQSSIEVLRGSLLEAVVFTPSTTLYRQVLQHGRWKPWDHRFTQYQMVIMASQVQTVNACCLSVCMYVCFLVFYLPNGIFSMCTHFCIRCLYIQKKVHLVLSGYNGISECLFLWTALI